MLVALNSFIKNLFIITKSSDLTSAVDKWKGVLSRVIKTVFSSEIQSSATGGDH